jgi:hypothetical protein
MTAKPGAADILYSFQADKLLGLPNPCVVILLPDPIFFRQSKVGEIEKFAAFLQKFPAKEDDDVVSDLLFETFLLNYEAPTIAPQFPKSSFFEFHLVFNMRGFYLGIRKTRIILSRYFYRFA